MSNGVPTGNVLVTGLWSSFPWTVVSARVPSS